MRGGGGVAKGLRKALLLLPIAITALAITFAETPRPASALDGEEAAVLDLINQYRSANGLGTLSQNGTLNNAARWMSDDMASNNYFSHTDSQGRDPFVRLADFGYTYNTWKGENLAAGIDSAQEAFDLWKGSPGHNANMLNPNFTVIGIARSYGPSSTFGWYWSTDFGGQGDYVPPPPPAPTEAPAPPAPVSQPPAVTTPETPPPTPVDTPLPTVQPTHTPVPTRAPRLQDVAAGARPWWDRLTVVGQDGSVLRSVSYLAERYLERKGAQAANSGLAPDQSIRPEQLWPTTFS